MAKMTVAQMVARMDEMDARLDRLTSAVEKLVSTKSKGDKAPTAKSGKTVSSRTKSSKKTSDSSWNESAYRKAVADYGVDTKNGGCYKFCRPLFVAFAKGEITDKELAKQFKALPKPEWFEA